MSSSTQPPGSDTADPVVIVGMALEAPGGIETADDYWALLTEQREALGRFPADRGWSVRELFERASAAKPCVLFFDEFDSIAPKRCVMKELFEPMRTGQLTGCVAVGMIALA